MDADPCSAGRRAIAAAAMMLGLLGAGTAATAACTAHVFDVDVAPFGAVSLAADLCGLDRAPAPAVVQILLHGGAYDRRYWALPRVTPEASYTAAATARGYVTVNLDRLGYGASTRPDGTALTFARGAAAVSAVVDQIAAGALGHAPRAIVLNGHSMGGIVAEIVAAENDHVAALIVSGLANTPDAAETEAEDGGPPPGGPPFIPATEDPRFAKAAWADGYMTTAPGRRLMLFHAPGTIDEDVPALEETLRDTIAGAELRSVLSGQTDRPDFDGPSVHFLGQYDAIACAGQDCSTRFAGTDWHVIIPDAGHSLNLSRAAPVFFAATFDWLAARGLAP